MRRAIVAAVLLLLLVLPADPTQAVEQPTASEIVEAMRSCLPISAVERDGDELIVSVDGMHEPLFIGSRPSNTEQYAHWWNPDVTLTFVRLMPGFKLPAPRSVMRRQRNQAILCYLSVPLVPDSYGADIDAALEEWESELQSPP